MSLPDPGATGGSERGRASDGPAALEVADVSKHFGPVRVLDRVSFAVHPGEIHALVGENGSGKSTLLKILSGFYSADPGAQIRLDSHGVRFVHQDLGLVPSLNAIDNIALGQGYRASNRWYISWRAEAERAAAVLRRLGHDLDVRRPVGELRMSEQTAVAIARALAGPDELKVLVLDEPTANLPVDETSQLLDLLRRMRAEGKAIVLVSHHFDEVFGFADTVTVLRDGARVATRPVDGLTRHELVELMLGHGLERPDHVRRAVPSRPVLECSGLSGVNLRDLDVAVSAGEVVGIAGVTGSGREEVIELIAGGAARTGVVTVDGDELRPGRPDLALAAGVGIVPSARIMRAVVGTLNVRENLVLTDLRRSVSGGSLRPGRERTDVASWLTRLDVRGQQETPLLNLSGGNQQKVILGRCLRPAPRVVLLDQPTQGVDIGAKEHIYRVVDDAVGKGAAVLVASTDTEELVRICDRVLVLSGGRVALSLAGTEIGHRAITRALNQPRAVEHAV